MFLLQAAVALDANVIPSLKETKLLAPYFTDEMFNRQ